MLVDGISGASSLADSRTLHTCGFWLSYDGAVNGNSLRLYAAAIIPSTNTAQLHIAAPTLPIEVPSNSPCYTLLAPTNRGLYCTVLRYGVPEIGLYQKSFS
jgi:hypothetical protein